MSEDTLADALSAIKNSDRIGKKECVVRKSKLVMNVLNVMKKHGYIKDFEIIKKDNHDYLKVHLSNKIIDCNAIKPRFPCKIEEISKFEKRYLPARNVGILILTTSKGVMDHKEALANNVGGALLAFVY